MSKKIIAVDLDDTLCERPNDVEGLGVNKYKTCTPIQSMIDLVNKLHDDGHTIIIYTARGMTTFHGDVDLIYIKLYNQTINDLNRWGVKFHQLVMGKLHYDLLIDDKAACFDNIEPSLEKLK